MLTHEQTRFFGLTNKIIGVLAKKIAISWQATQNISFTPKVIYTGLPLRPSIFKVNRPLALRLTKPLLYVSGGSQGSHTINMALKPILARILAKYSLVHQTGNNQTYKDYELFLKLRDSLPVATRENYLPLPFVDEEYIGWLYSKIHLAVGRSGANTVAELAALGIPAIFIPLPFASGNEQYLNAKLYEDNHAGTIISQGKLTPQHLLAKIDQLESDYDEFKSNARKLKDMVPDGTSNLVKLIEDESSW